MTMLNRISNFILYHNGFTFLVWFVLLSGGTALAANSDVRDAVATSVIASNDTVRQIDNSLIVNTDLDQFNFALQVTGVTEDDFTYYVTYTYRTLEVRDGVWQQVDKADSLTISKSQLGSTDFETFIQQQLAEFIEAQRQLLAETQNIERTLGQTPLVVERSYTGLIGRFLDTKEIISEQNAAAAAAAAAKEAALSGATTTDNMSDNTSNIGGNNASSTEPSASSTPGSIATSTPDSTATSTATSTGSSTGATDPGTSATTTEPVATSTPGNSGADSTPVTDGSQPSDNTPVTSVDTEATTSVGAN